MFDRRGNPVSTASAAALDAAESALWRMMSFYGTPLDDLDTAAAADPDWLLPPLMRAGFLLSLTEPTVHGEAEALLDAAASRAPRAVEREQRHFDALRRLAVGDWLGASEAWEAILLRHPRDALALQWAHLFDFHRGDAVQLRQRVARVLPEWDPADALHPYLLGLHAFGLEECHLHAEAEAVGGRALAGPARVPWAIHAVAHVMEMQGRHEDGTAWMARWRGDWAEGNGFAGHLGWHDALFALERLDADAALAAFDAHLAADPAQISLQRLDAAALLWRVQLQGQQGQPGQQEQQRRATGDRWRRLVDGWALPAASAGLYPFNDLHALLALVGAGDSGAAADWVAAVGARTPALPDHALAVTVEVGLPAMRGLLAFGHGDFAAAVDTLYPLRAAAHRLGGSHAQRDVVDQTILAAAAESPASSRQRDAGRAVLNERRLAKRPTPLTAHWIERLGRRPPTSV